MIYGKDGNCIGYFDSIVDGVMMVSKEIENKEEIFLDEDIFEEVIDSCMMPVETEQPLGAITRSRRKMMNATN